MFMFDVRSRFTIIFMWFFYLSYTLRAVFLKAQVSKDSYPLDPSALGTGSLLPTGYRQPGLTS